MGVIDEEKAYTNQRGNLNPPKGMLGREPEGEPELEQEASRSRHHSVPPKIGNGNAIQTNQRVQE